MSLQPYFQIRKCLKIWIIPLSVIIFITILLVWQERRPQNYGLTDLEEEMHLSQFSNFNNEVGADELIVPNIVHFIVFERPNISFVHFVCILAVMRNQKPENIYFHTNVKKFVGKYWKRLISLKQFRNILKVKKIKMPTEIFNQTIRKNRRVFHGGDIARLRVLMEYGGIYLDNDSYIVKSLDFYRKFEMAIGWDDGKFMGTQIIVAHKEARFLRLWLQTYDGDYHTNMWYFNAGELPTTVLNKRPYLVHRVRLLFGNRIGIICKLFQRYWPHWRNNYAFHLLARKAHQSMLHSISKNATYPVDFDEFNLQNYPITFREMANEVLKFEKSLRVIG